MKKITLAILAILLVFQACGRNRSPQSQLKAYFDYLDKHDLKQANSLWQDPFVSTDSLIDWHYAWSETKLLIPSKSNRDNIVVVSSDQNQALLQIESVNDNNDVIKLNYYALNTPQGWRLVNPPEVLCAGWDSVVIHELVLKFNPVNKPEPRYYQALTAMYEYTKTILGSNDNTKIRVFLTDSNEETAKLACRASPRSFWSSPLHNTVIFAKSVPDKTTDSDLINARIAASALVPIIAYSIGDSDPYDCPLIRDGLAAYFWGIDGISADLVKARTNEKYDSFPPLDSLLDVRFFKDDEQNNAAIAATFIDYLIVQYGLDKMKEIYKNSISAKACRDILKGLEDIYTLDSKWKSHVKKLNLINLTKIKKQQA